VTTITIDDAEVKRMLGKLESAEPMKAGLKVMAGYLRGKMSVYPPTDGNRPPQPFVSEKQRRYFFAALRDGNIKMPYRRSGNLSKRWGQSEADGGLTQVIGNDAGYAPFVIGMGSQSGYMKSLGWRSTADVVEREADAAFRTFVVGFRQSMQGRG
jgi:hypothetical protein